MRWFKSGEHEIDTRRYQTEYAPEPGGFLRSEVLVILAGLAAIGGGLFWYLG